MFRVYDIYRCIGAVGVMFSVTLGSYVDITYHSLAAFLASLEECSDHSR